jgi:thiol-disulfide isomerase/thioredoxin
LGISKIVIEGLFKIKSSFDNQKNKYMRKIKALIGIIVLSMLMFSCNSGAKDNAQKGDSTSVEVDTSSVAVKDSVSDGENQSTAEVKADVPKILIYSFHVTNRCASCIAIEESTKKVLNTYFKNEVNSGQIKLNILNVDDKENEKIAEKYQAFGSGLFVTRLFKGKESTTDLTGDGFKYARNKQDKFIEVLKGKIQEYLK